MENQFDQTPFSKAMLTGVFVGFFATLICLIYNVIFREATGFLPADFINVSTLIFVQVLVCWIAGVVYAALLRSSKNATGIYEVIFILLMGFSMWKIAGVHRWDDAHENAEFVMLAEGVLGLTTLAILLIPFLYHNRKFNEQVI